MVTTRAGGASAEVLHYNDEWNPDVEPTIDVNVKLIDPSSSALSEPECEVQEEKSLHPSYCTFSDSDLHVVAENNKKVSNAASRRAADAGGGNAKRNLSGVVRGVRRRARLAEEISKTDKHTLDYVRRSSRRNADDAFDRSNAFDSLRKEDATSFFSMVSDRTLEKVLEEEQQVGKTFLLSRVADPTSYFFKYRMEVVPPPRPHRMDIHVVDIRYIKPHEEVVSHTRVKALAKAIICCGAYKKPVLIDKNSGALLDGHHRLAAARLLHLRRIPVVLVDYLADDSITVDTWPGCGRECITKQDVIDMSISPNLFPPKTSRHNISRELPPIFVPLSILQK